MAKPHQQWIQFLYGPIFKVIGFFYRNYKANRQRIEDLTAGAGFSRFLKLAAVLLLMGWILVWYLAPQGSGDRLTEEVKSAFGGLKSSSQ